MTAQDLWAKWLTFYGWLGGHPALAGFILGALTTLVVLKAL